MTFFEAVSVQQLIDEAKASIEEGFDVGAATFKGTRSAVEYDPDNIYVLVMNTTGLPASSLGLDYQAEITFSVTESGTVTIQGFTLTGTSDNLPTEDLEEPQHPIGLN